MPKLKLSSLWDQCNALSWKWVRSMFSACTVPCCSSSPTAFASVHKVAPNMTLMGFCVCWPPSLGPTQTHFGWMLWDAKSALFSLWDECNTLSRKWAHSQLHSCTAYCCPSVLQPFLTIQNVIWCGTGGHPGCEIHPVLVQPTWGLPLCLCL